MIIYISLPGTGNSRGQDFDHDKKLILTQYLVASFRSSTFNFYFSMEFFMILYLYSVSQLRQIAFVK